MVVGWAEAVLSGSRLMDDYLETQLLGAATKLNIADALVGGSWTPEALAQAATEIERLLTAAGFN